MTRRLTMVEAARLANDVSKVGDEGKDNIKYLVKVGGLDPSEDFRFENWTGVSFAGHDLTGFDFTGANIIDCDFTGASIVGARFDNAQIGYTLLSRRMGSQSVNQRPHDVVNLRLARDWEEFAKKWQPPNALYPDGHLSLGAIFQDAPFAPELSVVPSASGTRRSDLGDEVRTSRPALAVGRHVVTFAEWDFFARERNMTLPKDEGWGRGRMPVINVNWQEVSRYIDWLSERTRRRYRLLSDVEWETCCRSGSSTLYHTGDHITAAHANFSNGDRDHKAEPMEVGSFPPNGWGLFDMHGNVWEMCEDRFQAAWSSDVGNTESDDKTRLARGGAFSNPAEFLQSTFRRKIFEGNRHNWLGFRITRNLSDSFLD